MTKERETKKVWTRSISQELHEAWKRLRRTGDPELMAKDLGYSRPVIDRALKYGYISMPELTEKINKFFLDRLNKERGKAQELMAMANQAAVK
jgi:hypothetical protein